ncbi:WhiB family transcriptional regulator [Streptomyces sp. NPDC014646]|uniref:WhiB family transcriptional regulator n=1 Tax=Streptomyces sp. NPDC014646 TaxID=3364877 RepID=UPI0036F4FE78
MKLRLVNARLLTRDGGLEGVPACRGVDPEIFFPEASYASASRPSPEEREALAVCARCTVREWCLAREMAECTVTDRVVGVRGGLRQADRRALHQALTERGQR